MYDRVSWDHVESSLRQEWRQGQHVVICAPTGRGKTYLAQRLLPMRSSVVIFGTKKDDPEYANILAGGYHRLQTWPPRYGFERDRAMLWPRFQRGMSIRDFTALQERVFRPALDNIFAKGKRTAYFDELHWMAQDLGMYREIATLHHQGRSSGLTFIDGFQRPSWVPPVVYSSATHVFVWGTNYDEDLKRLRSVAKLDALTRADMKTTMGSLDEFECVYVNVRGQQPPVITQVDRTY